MMDPRFAPARIRPNADLAVCTSIDAFTKDQKWHMQMLPNDSIAQYDTHPGKRVGVVDNKKKREGSVKKERKNS